MSDSPQGKILQVEFESDEDVAFSMSTNLLINFDSEHFYVRFFQVKPPAALNRELPDTVKAKLVAGIIIPASKMQGIVNALQENYAKYLEVQEQVEDGLIDKLKDGDDE